MIRQTVLPFKLERTDEALTAHGGLALFDEPRTPYVYHVIATNWPAEEKAAQAVLDWHNHRGQAENMIKELTNMTSGWSGSPACLCVARRQAARPGPMRSGAALASSPTTSSSGARASRVPRPGRRHTIATLRWTLVQVAGRIIRHAGQVVLRLVVEAATLARFRGIRRQCWALRGAT